ncbi:MAG: hypothetical protein ACE5OZ_25010 [Candidatus Heimdallarchaeota archaeon]
MISFIARNPDDPSIISRHAFGVYPDKIGEIVLLMERDRIEQYKGAFDKILYELKGGVYNGITGLLADTRISAIYSKSPADIADCVSFLGMSRTSCHTIFSTGSIGGLGVNVEMADLVMADEAIGNDGYSIFLARREEKPPDYFFDNVIQPKGNVADLVEEAVQSIAEEFGVQWHRGRIFTTPAVSLETEELLHKIVDHNCIAIDMETAPFYAACQEYGFQSLAIHWVTDLPLTRSFFYRFSGDPKVIQQDWNKKHPLWLNMPHILVSILRGYIQKKDKFVTP